MAQDEKFCLRRGEARGGRGLEAVSSLLLKRASASHLSGEWNDDDYDVLADGAVVDRMPKDRVGV